MKWSLGDKGLLVLAIPFAVQIILLVTLGAMQRAAEQASSRVETGLHISQSLSSLLQDFIDIRINAAKLRSKYLMSERFMETREHAMDQLHTLKAALKDEPENLAVIDTIEAHAKQATQMVMGSEKSGDNYGRLSSLDEIAFQIQKDTVALSDLVQKEEALVGRLTEDLKTQGMFYQFTLYGGSLFQVLTLGAAIAFFGYDITRRIRVMQENSVLLAMRKPLSRELGGTDELSQLDRVFHKMAAELDEAAQVENVLTENVRAVFCTLDAKLVFSATNSASLHVFGSGPEELIGTRLASLLPATELELLLPKFERSKTGIAPPFELQIIKSDGAPTDTLWAIHWSKAESAYVCVVHDNSERKASQRLRERLLAMVTDDLKRPLSKVGGFLKSLQQGEFGALEGRGETLVVTADGATSQMLTLVNDLLDIEQLEGGTLRVNCEKLEIEKLFSQAVQSATAVAKRAGIELESFAGGQQIIADRDRMMQILINLISNSVKFSPKGSKISLEAHAADDSVEVKVIDRGRGIPPEAVPFIFERFRQTERADATVKKGVGLGLSITKALV
jgi:signal transduction histidine kinase